MIEMIVGRIHVSKTNREVIREVRKSMKPEAFALEHLAWRLDVYRQAIEAHARNRDMYRKVMTGDFS